MHSNQGYTVTPVSYTSDATGEEIIQDFEVVGTASGEEARTNDVRQQEERFVVDDDGQTHYDNQVSEDDYQNLLDGYGEETFSQVTQWAENTFSPEEIASYDAIVNNGDLVEIASAMETVYQLWNDRNLEPDLPNPQQEVEDTDANWVFTEIIPQSEYEELVSYAREHFEESFVDNYNLIVQSGDRAMIEKTIQLLKTKVNEERT